MKVLYTTLNAKFIHSSLALRYLRAMTKDIAATNIKEYTINTPILDIVADIYKEQPEIVGLACYIWNIEETLKVAELIKKVLPGTLIVLGGPEVSYDAPEIMQQSPFVDFIIMGEGELIMRELLICLQDQVQPRGLPGLVWRYGTEVVVNGGVQVVSQLNEIVFPYQDEDLTRLQGKIIYYETSRGCPFSCQYCLSSITRGVRFFSTERVIEELGYLISYNVRQIKFVDRTYNINREHFFPIMKFLAAQDCATNFHFEITADLLNHEIMDFLQTVPKGRFQFEIGVQSTNPLTLEHSGRHNDWLRIVENVKKIKDFGNIHIHLDLIAGLPYEDYKSFGQSFNDVYQLRPDALQLGFLKLLKGSPMREKSAIYSMIAMSTPPYEILSTHVMSYQDMRRLKIVEAVVEYYANSHKFGAVLVWLIQQHKEDAFALFIKLAEYWDERDLHLVAHSFKSLVDHLYNFCENNFSEYRLTYVELFKYDCLRNDRGRIKPTYLDWNDKKYYEEKSDFWRDNSKVTKYIADFKFHNWREVQNSYAIEVFNFDVQTWLKNQGLIKWEPAAILFSFDAHDCVTVLAKDDFFYAL